MAGIVNRDMVGRLAQAIRLHVLDDATWKAIDSKRAEYLESGDIENYEACIVSGCEVRDRIIADELSKLARYYCESDIEAIECRINEIDMKACGVI